MNFLSHSSPLQALHSKLFPGIELWVKRDDLLHPQISGNKSRKLKYPLLALAADPARTTVVSMGGAWSNHLHALAYAGQLLNFKTLGLVRGLRDDSHALTVTLNDCAKFGMQLRFLSRNDYRELRDNSRAWHGWTDIEPSKCLWLPEGGSSIPAVHGIAELVTEIVDVLGSPPERIIVACGTGATLTGIIAGMQNQGNIIGIAAVQNADYLHTEVRQLLALAGYPAYENFDILHHFTHGGFAKTSPTLLNFCAEFSAETQIPVEPVYTGKMFFALHQLCLAGEFKQGEKIVAIHTGGLQGNRGFS
ncbi:1-aminocyclopropane-1-carboxylate deaminase/D-cysteine desulfhydrase [Undibacterium sp.]|uniref:1-aminocyclopropane-1-carboxylate deaminase/D-cysteine desulfhydrase n=1 Tax=Undibacterium sp. TaxID=1914977 RepID=UPI003753A3DE